MRTLEERLLEVKGQLARAMSQNDRLASTLREARDRIASLREEVEKLSSPPSGYGLVLDTNDDGTIDVFTGGRKMRVERHPDLEDDLNTGTEVVLNESMNVVMARDSHQTGSIVSIVEVLNDDRCVVSGRADEERVVTIGEALRDELLRAGDAVRVDAAYEVALEKLPRPEVEHLMLEDVPDVSYNDIGGLGPQIEAITDAVELPFLHSDLFLEHELPAPKGILLYGPPGCGKTMIAKAVANSLAQKVKAQRSEDEGDDGEVRSYFFNIKGPELLNKYVGETERQIRLVFQRAREKSEEGWPVIVFFDEMESLFRTRGSGVSSDVETTIVPQLLAEIDGVESLKDVVVIGASNREDMIDPAILRPGRLDVKIKVERPDEAAAREIFAIYLHSKLPLHPDELGINGGDELQTVAAMIDRTVTKMYADDEDNRFLEVTYANGEKEILYFKDFNSGAMIENVVARAKKYAIKRFLAEGVKGLKADDMMLAIRDEFRENEDLPNTTNPDDWARISGKKGERIVYIRTLISDNPSASKAIENVSAGQYL